MHVSSGDLSGMNDTKAVFFLSAVIQGQLFEARKKSNITFSWDVKCRIVVEIL